MITLPRFIGPLTWAFVIIIGGLMITPGGINPIVINPAFRVVMGVVSIGVGALGFTSILAQSSRA